jgi:hypothetical protein
VATIETWRTMTSPYRASVGPTDRELVDALHRVARARAHLIHAERQAEADRLAATPDERNRQIEDARSEVLWRQASVLAAPRSAKAAQALVVAQARERAALQRFGYSSFADYREQRQATPSTDVRLLLARREHEAAQQAWQQLQEACDTEIVIDLTGDEPQIIT